MVCVIPPYYALVNSAQPHVCSHCSSHSLVRQEALLRLFKLRFDSTLCLYSTRYSLKKPEPDAPTSRGQTSFYQEETLSRTRRPPADGWRSSGDTKEGEEDASTNHCKYICHGLTATLLRRYSAALEVIPERHSSILHKAAERTWTVELFTTLPMSSLHSDIPGFSSSRLEENARTCEWKYSETHTETDFRSFSCLSWMPLCRDQKQLWPWGKDPTLQLQRQNRGAKIIIFRVISAPRPSRNAVVCYLLHDILKKKKKNSIWTEWQL